MKIFIYLASAVIFFACLGCEKENFTQQTEKTLVTSIKMVEVKHGMLVFDSKESFLKTLAEVRLMNLSEKENWEKKLGFKSFDRLCLKIIEAEIIHNQKYENLNLKEQNILKKTKIYKEYSDIAIKYIEKGVARIKYDENGEKHLEFPCLLFSSLINEDGLIAFGNNIYQYTETQFKYLKSLDFEKIEKLKTTKILTNSEELFVANLRISENKSVVLVNMQAISHVIDKKKIVLSETGIYYGPYSDGTTHGVYNVNARPEKKNWLGNWIGESARIWLDGYCQIYDGDTNPTFSFDRNDVNTSTLTETPYDQWYPAGHSQPSIPYSYSSAVRWGGPSGIGVNITNHLTIGYYP